MLISTLPLGVSVTGVTIASSDSTAAFVTSPSALYDGQPGTSTRFSWVTAGSPAITDWVSFTVSLSAPIPARCLALLEARFSTANLIPAGVKVTAAGKLSASPVTLGGNTQTGVRTFLHPNGAVRRPFVFLKQTIDQAVFTVWNDKNGSPWATAGELVDLGELWVGKGSDYAIANDYAFTIEGGTLQRKSHENLNWAWAIRAYEENPFNVVAMTQQQAIGPRTDEDPFQVLAYELAQNTASVLIPAYLAGGTNQYPIHAPPRVIDTTTIDEQRLCCTFAIGNLGDQGISMKGNNDLYQVAPFSFGSSAP